MATTYAPPGTRVPSTANRKRYPGLPEGGFGPQSLPAPAGIRDPGGNAPTVAPRPQQGQGGFAVQPQYGYNPNPGRGTFNKAYQDYGNLPTVSGQLNNAPNPQGIYNPIMGGAQRNVSGYFGGQSGAFDPNSNAWLNRANEYMNNAPPLPGSPDLQFGPSSYQGSNAPAYNGGPTYEDIQFGRFNSAGVTGPGTSNFTDPRDVASGVSGPQTDYERLYSQTQNGPVNRVGSFGPMGAGPGREATGVARENIEGSGYRSDESFANPESVSRQGFGAGLRGANEAMDTGFNDEVFKKSAAAIKRELGAARLSGETIAQEEVGGRGIVYDPSSGVSQEAFAKYYAPAQAQAARAFADLSERQTAQALEQKRFGAGLAANVGSSAAGAAQGFASLSQQEAARKQEGALTQRSQDVDQQGQRITERGQDINRELTGRSQDVDVRGQQVTERGQDINSEESRANRAIEVERLRNDNYQAQTQRMTGLGQLVNQMEQARAGNNVDAYNSATQRLQTEYGYDADMARNAVAGFQAATQRGEVGQQAWAESQRLGFDYAGLQQRYDELAANNQNLRNTNLIDVMRITGDQANERVRTVLGSMGDYANTLQQGQIANMENAWHRATLAADIMQDGAQASQFWTQAIMNATEQDREAFLHMWDVWVGDQTRKNQGKFFSPGAGNNLVPSINLGFSSGGG